MPLDRNRLNKALEPPSIEDLASFMRDGEWVDMRVVDAGDFQRVMITCLHIYPDRDLVTVVQNFRHNPEEAAVTKFSLDVDCEDIMYAHPTECASVDDVKPIEAPHPDEDRLPDGFEAQKEAAIQAVIDVTGGSLMKLIAAFQVNHGRLGQDIINQRHLVLWALVEMTDVNPSRLCVLLGWRSPMPFQSCRYKFSGHNAEEKWPPIITNVVKRAQQLGGQPWHRSPGDSWYELCVTK